MEDKGQTSLLLGSTKKPLKQLSEHYGLSMSKVARMCLSQWLDDKPGIPQEYIEQMRREKVDEVTEPRVKAQWLANTVAENFAIALDKTVPPMPDRIFQGYYRKYLGYAYAHFAEQPLEYARQVEWLNMQYDKYCILHPANAGIPDKAEVTQKAAEQYAMLWITEDKDVADGWLRRAFGAGVVNRNSQDEIRAMAQDMRKEKTWLKDWEVATRPYLFGEATD